MKIRRTCLEVTRLLLQSQDRPLHPLETASLQLHWLACRRCRDFRSQQRLMRAALDRWKTYRDTE